MNSRRDFLKLLGLGAASTVAGAAAKATDIVKKPLETTTKEAAKKQLEAEIAALREINKEKKKNANDYGNMDGTCATMPIRLHYLDTDGTGYSGSSHRPPYYSVNGQTYWHEDGT